MSTAESSPRPHAVASPPSPAPSRVRRAGVLGLAGALMVSAGSTTAPDPAPADSPTAEWVDISPPTDLTASDENYGIHSMAIAPSDPGTLYVGTSGDGVWRTDDHGATWVKTSTGRNGANLDTGRQWTMAVSPDDPEVVYTTSGYGQIQGVWKSTDGGVSWTQMLDDATQASTTADIYNIDIDPADGDHLLAGSHSPWPGDRHGVLESTDGGDTWTAHDIAGGWDAGYYALFVDSTTWLVTTQYDGLWRTDDSGTTWSQVSDVDMGHGGTQLTRLADGTLIVGALGRPLLSRDDGVTWEPIGVEFPANYYAVGGDGTWLWTQPANTGLNALDPDPAFFIMRADDPTTWWPYAGGEQTFANGPIAMAYDPDAEILYAASWNAGVWKLELS